MISAIVFTPDTWPGEDLVREREIVARSMVWLVSAVIGGVVRDVTLAVPAGLGLGELADQSGCELVQAEDEAARVAQAAAGCREPRVLLLQAGFQPEAGLVDEIEIVACRGSAEPYAALLVTPQTFLQRLFPQWAPVVGMLVPREAVSGGLKVLARRARRATVLGSRAHPIR